MRKFFNFNSFNKKFIIYSNKFKQLFWLHCLLLKFLYFKYKNILN
uniref:Uncharacterized protein n=1 Tax=Nephromyces sp. ex Molgula occidentalis TaxID=2544991 RepID=A0A5C1H7I5_9APIC|nr:hypothetical protein [Nephromyces sp. ex Molgula occidentalis]